MSYNGRANDQQYKGIAKYGEMFLEGFELGRSWEYDADLDLYYQVTNVSSTYVRIDFRNDPGDPTVAGQIDVRLIDDEPYPVAVRLDFAVVGGNDVMNGWMILTVNDASLEYGNLEMAFQMTTPSAVIACDIGFSPTAYTGTILASIEGNDFLFRNIVVSGDDLFCDYYINGVVGSVVIFSDGSGAFSIDAEDGTYVLYWDTTYRVTLDPPVGANVDLGYMWDL